MKKQVKNKVYWVGKIDCAELHPSTLFKKASSEKFSEALQKVYF